MSLEGSREFDIVLVGATGYVGRLVAQHLARTAPPQARMALAGRDVTRVRQVRDAVGLPGWQILSLDLTDADQLAQVCRDARVVVTTAGPYRTMGAQLVDACAAAGTDYLDLAGEVLFVSESTWRNHELARSTGARIVHSAGFDSIPSDLTVALAAQQAQADGAGHLTRARLYVTEMLGGMSGGTVASAVTQADECREDRDARRVVMDQLAMVRPTPAGGGPRQPLGNPVTWDRDVQQWTGPFFMSPYNTRVVQRAHALRGGGDLDYAEHTAARGTTGLLRTVVTTGVVGAAAALMVRGGQWWRPLLPKPGTGPSERSRQAGRYTVRTLATAADGSRYVAQLSDRRDPGYGSTAVMLGQSALALAFDDLPAQGGALPPSVALGDALVARLREQGFGISVRRES